MGTDRTRDLAGRLRDAGFRVTGSRMAILRALERNRTHPGAWEIHRALKPTHPSLSVSTVNTSTRVRSEQAPLLQRNYRLAAVVVSEAASSEEATNGRTNDRHR